MFGYIPGICTQGVQAVAFLTSQGAISQACLSVLSPSHSVPPFLGTGLLHSRCLSFHPPEGPQPGPPDAVQVDQGPQSDQPPSTAARFGSENEDEIKFMIF